MAFFGKPQNPTPAPAATPATGAPALVTAPPSMTAPAPAPGAGFAVGTTGALGPATASTVGANASASAAAPASTGTDSFNFSTPAAYAASNSNATATATGTPAATPATGIPALSTSSFAFGGAPSAPASGGWTAGVPPPANQPNNATNSATMQVPSFEELFPNVMIWLKISRMLKQIESPGHEGQLACQELAYVLRCDRHSQETVGHLLSNPQTPQWKAADMNLRNRLASNPTVMLSGNREAPLTEPMLREIFSIADDLRISEQESVVLYEACHDMETHALLEEHLEESIIDKALSDKPTISPSKLRNDTGKAACELFFFERHCILKTLLDVIQKRLQSDGTPWGRAFLAATDCLILDGLFRNLVKIVHEWNRISQEISVEIERAKASDAMGFPFQDRDAQPKPIFASALLLFANKGRQTAAECIFYLAYNTQLMPEEVTNLLDLVKDLCNGLPGNDGLKLLDPYHDVPSPHQEPPPEARAWAPLQATMPPLVNKDKFKWQRELVSEIWKRGMPQLLQCVGTLTLSVVCALDSRHVLMDRSTHAPNLFGIGNNLWPPGEVSPPESLAAIHSRLHPDAAKEWNRRDVWGLLAASYALFLRSIPSVSTSPRSQALVSTAFDARASCRACLEAPTECKSFTFARLTLLPALERSPSDPARKCDNSEFFLAVLAEFLSKYLDVLCSSGDLPVSRALWEKDEEEELKLKRSQREQQRQFQVRFGTRPIDEDAIPAAVDLMMRPDCMEDVIALAVAVCSCGSPYALAFWSCEDLKVGGEDQRSAGQRLVPSEALLALERLQDKDMSLLPSYLSFLAALSLADSPDIVENGNGASAVHKILSKNTEDESTSRPVSWTTILEALRWYARELSPHDYGVATADPSSLKSSGPTSYYYTYTSSTDRFGNSHRETRSSSTGTSKTKELGETNTVILLSNLALIANVASRSPAARYSVLSIKLPLGDSNGAAVAGEDPTLTVLFSLACAPLRPEVRGATFAAISTLLQDNGVDVEEAKFIQDMARKGWDFFESCQILPIAVLDQYTQLSEGSLRSEHGLRFPPSSTAMAETGANNAWMPANPRLGIIYEMEYVEAQMGIYPSTEGALQLLHALVATCGCPDDLGQNWRTRSGCTPYIEYIIYFVLPRATASVSSNSRLPFRTFGDRSRLVSRALSVVEAVLARYAVPRSMNGPSVSSPSAPKLQDMIDDYRSRVIGAADVLGIPTLAEQVVVEVDKSEAELSLLDFRNSSVTLRYESQHQGRDSLAVPGGHQAFSSSISGGASPSVPRPKSPGFVVLADLLSSSNGELFVAIAEILVCCRGAAGIEGVVGSEADRYACAYALFGDAPPTIASAKMGSKDKLSRNSSSTASKQSLLKPLLPVMKGSLLDVTNFGDGNYWRELEIIKALRVLCAAAVREEAFYGSVNSAPEPLNTVLVLRFQRDCPRPTLKVVDVLPLRMRQLLLSYMVTDALVSSIVEYIGYKASNDTHDTAMSCAAASLSFLVYPCSPDETSAALPVDATLGYKNPFAHAAAKRLRFSSRQPQSKSHKQCARLILDRILSDLRNGCHPTSFVAETLLGLRSAVEVGSRRPGERYLSNPCDCFDTVIELLCDDNFILGENTSEFASSCFEILFRLCNLTATIEPSMMYRLAYASTRLRSIDFWHRNLLMLLAPRTVDDPAILRVVATQSYSENSTGSADLIHSYAWLLKGVAAELRLLLGLPDWSRYNGQLGGLLAPRPTQFWKTFSLLFSEPHKLFWSLLECFPLERLLVGSANAFPSTEAVKKATKQIPGAQEIAEGYNIVSENRLVETMKAQDEFVNSDELRNWAQQWNRSISWDCACSHLASATRILLGSAFLGSRELLARGSMDDVIDPIPFREMRTGLRVADLSGLLWLALNRVLHGQDQEEGSKGMDDRLFPSATWEISLAVLLLSEETASVCSALKDAQHSHATSDLVAISVLLAKAVSFSLQGSGRECSRRFERTAVLGSALNILLRAIPGHYLTKANRIGLEEVASALAYTSSRGVNPLSGTSGFSEPTAAAIVARSCLSALIDICEDEECSTRAQSFLTRALDNKLPVSNLGKDTHLGAFIGLLSSLDENIPFLLDKVAQRRFGGALLLDSGLFDALHVAANNYLAEESRCELHSSTVGGKSQVLISAPTFLAGHFNILNSVLGSSCLSNNQRRSLPRQAMEAIRRYGVVVDRLFDSFPLDGDVLQALIHCLLQASVLWQTMCESDSSNMSFTEHLKDAPNFAEWENRVLHLCMHVAQHPFPSDVMPLLPTALRHSDGVNSAIVAVSGVTTRSWWDEVVTATANVSPRRDGDLLMSERIYETCCLGADILVTGMSFLSKTDMVKSIDGLSLARGLVRCVDATRMIQERIFLLEDMASLRGNDEMDVDRGGSIPEMDIRLELKYLNDLMKKFKRCVGELLGLALARVRASEASNRRYESEAALSPKVLLYALDSAGIESSENAWEENGHNVALVLSRSLRRDLEQMVNPQAHRS